MSRTPLPSPARLLLLVAGFIIWSSAFLFLYTLNAIGCELAWDRQGFAGLSLQRGLLLLIWILHLAAIALLLRRLLQRREAAAEPLPRFLDSAALLASTAALLATLWTGLPLLGLSSCL